jgi:hypothetical protein
MIMVGRIAPAFVVAVLLAWASPAAAQAPSAVPVPQATDSGGAQEADREQPPRPGARKQGLMIIGLSILAAGYVASVATFALDVGLDKPRAFDAKLLIPILGPWIALDGGNPESPARNGYTGALISSGLVQGVGLVMAIAGITKYVTSGADYRPDRRRPTFQVTPTPNGAFGALSASF